MKVEIELKNLKNKLGLSFTSDERSIAFHKRNRTPGKYSKYRGVSFSKKNNKYIATITKNYKNHFIGLFESEQKAAIAYNEAAKLFYGENAKINVIEDEV